MLCRQMFNQRHTDHHHHLDYLDDGNQGIIANFETFGYLPGTVSDKAKLQMSIMLLLTLLMLLLLLILLIMMMLANSYDLK